MCSMSGSSEVPLFDGEVESVFFWTILAMSISISFGGWGFAFTGVPDAFSRVLDIAPSVLVDVMSWESVVLLNEESFFKKESECEKIKMDEV